jgi:predicted N-acyltransferase
MGAVAAFVKPHSYGEYIFDWGWADSSERAGIPYYPKLVIAAPSTPATGPRLLLDPAAPADLVAGALIAAVRELADRADCSSIHWLFCTAAEVERLAAAGFARRASFQFHWHNHGYASFDDFLGAMTSRRRKQIRKERERARAAVDAFRFVSGAELDRAGLDFLDRVYRRNTAAHGGMDYMRPGFFHALAEHMPDEVLVAQAHAGGRPVAAAMFLETAQALYGRYWGAARHVELLHFEASYYAGIERCIERGTPLFEAGAQGEHKLLRGFAPSPTHSAHWFRHPALDAGIRDFLDREAGEVRRRMDRLSGFLPFKDPG